MRPVTTIPWAKYRGLARKLVNETRVGLLRFASDGVRSALAARRETNVRLTAVVSMLVIGFYVGAKSVADTGYEFRGPVTEADLKMFRGSKFSDGVLVHIDDVKPARMSAKDGWSITDFRIPIGRHNGSPTTLFWAKFMPGAVHKKHRHDNCDEIYYIVRGHGLAGAGPDRAEVRGGHVHYIPKGVEHFLHNLSKTEPLEAIGIYIGAGSVEETGYVYTGDVTAADIKARTA